MGPNTDRDRLLFEVAAFRAEHPQVIIHSPAETLSRRWEVSFPASATIAFDEPEIMMQCLSMISIPDVDDDPE